MGLYKAHFTTSEKLKETIVHDISQAVAQHKSIVVCGEEGAGKITNTLTALHSMDEVYYIGNPVDYEGKWRPKGYVNYISFVMTLKRDMYIIANEIEILSMDPRGLQGKNAVVVIDEVFGRSNKQIEKLNDVFTLDGVKMVLITGCLKNIGLLVSHIEAGLMITGDGTLSIDRDFLRKICSLLRPESHSQDKPAPSAPDGKTKG